MTTYELYVAAQGGADGMLQILTGLRQHEGTDRQALDHVIARLQDVHGGRDNQIAAAVDTWRITASRKAGASGRPCLTLKGRAQPGD